MATAGEVPYEFLQSLLIIKVKKQGITMEKVIVIGAGGIGSWLIPRLARLLETNQLPTVSGITVADNDIVEDKNLLYQNFSEGDILMEKALSLEARYPIIQGKHERVKTHDQLDPYTIIICAVDNSNARELIYEHCDQNSEKYFIDLRAEGQAVYTITSDDNKTLDELKATLREAEDQSCQLDFELEQGIIQLGNTIVAEIGAQYLLNYVRSRPNNEFSRRF